MIYNFRKQLRFTFAILLGLSFTAVLQAQIFMPTSQSWPGLNVTTGAWGDIDNDGDMDVALSGWPNGGNTGYTGIWVNNNGTFAELPLTAFTPPIMPQLVGTNWSWDLMRWGDYNNDNLLDLAMVGTDTAGNNFTKIWRNEGSNTFFNSFDLVPGVYDAVIWGDVDNDGDLDIFNLGVSNLNGGSVLLFNNHNQGSNTFSTSTTTFPAITFGDGELGDYDADGDLDLVIIGLDTANQAITQIWNNDGEGNFTLSTLNLTPKVYSGDADFADLNNDGDLELILSGVEQGATSVSTKIFYWNAATMNFDTAYVGLTNVGLSGTAFGDYNHDGWVDVIALGDTTGGLHQKTSVYHSLLQGQIFPEDPLVNLTSLLQGAPSFLDYDGDGDLDIFIGGLNSIGQGETILYEEVDTAFTNQPPTAPTGLSASPAGIDAIHFSWSAATDDVTPSAGLSYHLMIDTVMNGYAFGSPMADTATGHRYIASFGDIKGLGWTLRQIQAGQTYCFRVSAIDGGMAGSDFSAAACGFTVGIADNEEQFTVNAWPIPAQDQLNLRVEGINGSGIARVISLDGRIMKEATVTNFDQHTMQVDDLAAGMYLLSVHIDGQSKPTVLRFVKE